MTKTETDILRRLACVERALVELEKIVRQLANAQRPPH